MISEYIEDRRKLDIPNYKRENFAKFLRYTPLKPELSGVVCFTHIEDDLDIRIEEQIIYFQQHCNEFEWKVYDFDHPQKLKERLLAHGFEQGDSEDLLVYDISQYQPASVVIPKNIEIRKISDSRGIEDIIFIQEEIWNLSFPWLGEQLESCLANTTIFCAYVDNIPIGSAWIDYARESKFAEIHGGAVLMKFRCQSVYSKLFELRMNDAKEKGVKYITVDAGLMSRPILEKKGFTLLSTTYPLTKKLHNS